jgi:hypothetical protein
MPANPERLADFWAGLALEDQGDKTAAAGKK